MLRGSIVANVARVVDVAHDEIWFCKYANQLLADVFRLVSRQNAAVDDGFGDLGQRVIGMAARNARRDASRVRLRVVHGSGVQVGNRNGIRRHAQNTPQIGRACGVGRPRQALVVGADHAIQFERKVVIREPGESGHELIDGIVAARL